MEMFRSDEIIELAEIAARAEVERHIGKDHHTEREDLKEQINMLTDCDTNILERLRDIEKQLNGKVSSSEVYNMIKANNKRTG